jgi:hypothetical protein
MKPLNLTGQKFGRLTIVERIGSLGGKSYWLGKCECGGTAKAAASNLTRKFVTSCGCFRKEFVRGNQLPEGESGFNGLFGRYQKRARIDGISFTLSKKDFQHLTQGHCYYCGAPPSQSISSRRSGKGRYSYNGIDRMDSSEGYVLGNCVPACKTCNYMKLDMSIENFISACKKVVEHSKIYE